MRKRLLSLIVAAIASAGLASAASAATVVFNNTAVSDTGTGNGVNIGVLSLQQHANATSEYGFTGIENAAGGTNAYAQTYTAAQTQTIAQPAGFTGNDLSFGSAITQQNPSGYTDSQVGISNNPSGYFARNTGFLAGAGVTTDNFAIIFQVGEGGNGSLTLNRFDVNFYNADGTLAFSANYPFPPVDAGTVLTGTGQGTAGWLFAVINFTASEKAWYDTGLGYVGLDVNISKPILNVDGEADNFLIGTTAATPVPVPAAAWMGLSALAGMGLFGKIRKRVRQA